MAAHALTFYGVNWEMDEVKELLRNLSNAVVARLDDHDVLIELRTTQTLMFQQMQALNSSLSETVKDHERRIRLIEKSLTYILGGGAVAWALFKVLVHP